jgi:hypothetical protein
VKGRTAIAGGALVLAACSPLPPAPGCPWLTVHSICHSSLDARRGLYDTHATQAGQLAIEVFLGGSDVGSVVDASRYDVANGELYQFWNSDLPFRMVYHESAGQDWLPASDKVFASPVNVCNFQ